MSRKKPERWSIRFELAPERDGDVSLHAHLLKLAGEGEASQWIRDTLIASLDKRLIPTTDKPLINGESQVKHVSPVTKAGLRIGWSKDQATGKKSSGKRVTHDVDDVDF